VIEEVLTTVFCTVFPNVIEVEFEVEFTVVLPKNKTFAENVPVIAAFPVAVLESTVTVLFVIASANSFVLFLQ
jgi:hypothetical protein